jgi:uncharacterized protein YqeY
MLDAKVVAMKAGDMTTKNALTAMIDAVQKAAITPKGRVEITEQLTDEVLIKYQKTIQEMIDTCPADRVDLLGKYSAEMEVVKVYAPRLITDPEEIIAMIFTILPPDMEMAKKNRGAIMKLITPYFKGRADMKIVNEVVGGRLV